jgi:hypothetical protein
MVPNPNLELADGSSNLLNYSSNNLTFKQSTAVTPRYGNYCGKVTYTSTTQMPVLFQSFDVKEATDYTASMWVRITNTLSTGLAIIGVCYAPDGTAFGDVLGGTVLNGATTAGFVRTSILLSVPVGAARMDVSWVLPTAQPSSFDYFYLDGIQLGPPGPFVDGNMSGYCWAGDKGTSYTLKTQFPSALRTFYGGPLNGTPSGMVAKAQLNGPNVFTLLD